MITLYQNHCQNNLLLKLELYNQKLQILHYFANIETTSLYNLIFIHVFTAILSKY